VFVHLVIVDFCRGNNHSPIYSLGVVVLGFIVSNVIQVQYLNPNIIYSLYSSKDRD